MNGKYVAVLVLLLSTLAVTSLFFYNQQLSCSGNYLSSVAVLSSSDAYSASNGTLSLSLQINYKDGSSGIYSVLPSLSLFTTSGSYVNSISVSLTATPQIVLDPGVTVTSWSATGVASGYIQNSNGDTLATVFSSAAFTSRGSKLVESTITVTSSYVSSDVIQGFYNGWVNGATYRYVWTLSGFNLTLGFSTGQSITRVASVGNFVWEFIYTTGATPTAVPTSTSTTTPTVTPTPTPTASYVPSSDAFGYPNPPGEYHCNPYFNPNDPYYMHPAFNPDFSGSPWIDNPVYPPWEPNPFYGVYFSVVGNIQPVSLSSAIYQQPSVYLLVFGVACIFVSIILLVHHVRR